jgi:hypothetical protein
MGGINKTAFLALFGLVIIQTSVGVIYKFASKSTGTYKFSQAGTLALSESVKFLISLLLLSSIKVHYHSKIKSDRSLISLFAKVSSRDRLGMMTLALGYTINNHLAFYLFKLADPGTIKN